MRNRLANDWKKTNRFSKAKLIGSKWTALPAEQQRSEIPYKHFLVVGWAERQLNKTSEMIEIEAVLTQHVYTINFKSLKDAERWKMGWQ